MKKKAVKAKKKIAINSKTKEIEILGRHPFYEWADVEFKQRKILGANALTWRHCEALYYASLPYDIPYKSDMHDEYVELENMKYVKVANDKSVKLTKLGKKLVGALRKDALMPGSDDK